MDELKKYLQENRAALDSEKPSATVFKRLQAQHPAKKKATVFSMLAKAAVAACILGAVLIALNIFSKKETGKSQISQTIENIQHPQTQEIALQPSPLPDSGVKAPQQHIQYPSMVKTNTPKKESASVPEQLLSSFEHNYNKLVSLQLQYIRTTPVYGESSNYFDDFKNALHQLDEEEFLVKKTIKTTGLNDALLEQLVNLYQAKTNLLKNLQQQVTRMNNRVKENSLPTDSVNTFYINI